MHLVPTLRQGPNCTDEAECGHMAMDINFREQLMSMGIPAKHVDRLADKLVRITVRFNLRILATSFGNGWPPQW